MQNQEGKIQAKSHKDQQLQASIVNRSTTQNRPNPKKKKLAGRGNQYDPLM